MPTKKPRWTPGLLIAYRERSVLGDERARTEVIVQFHANDVRIQVSVVGEILGSGACASAAKRQEHRRSSRGAIEVNEEVFEPKAPSAGELGLETGTNCPSGLGV